MQVEILYGVVSTDHVCTFLFPYHPQLYVNKLLKKVKGKASYKLQREFEVLRKEYWGQRMWERVYFACSTGYITDEVIKDDIDGHTAMDDQFKIEDEEDDDDFKS
jgi:putative transposase